MNAYAKYFDKYNKYMNLLVNNKEILEKYFEIWNKSCGYEPYLCNGCHDLKQKAINFNDVAIVFVKGTNYRIHLWYMSKNHAINVMNNSNLNEKRGTLYFFIINGNEWENFLSTKQRRGTK